MPHGKTKFQAGWLTKTDRNGHIVGEWLKENASLTSATCILCTCSVRFDNSGFQQILTHADGTKHKAIAKTRFSKKQQHFSTTRTQGAIELSSRTHDDQVTVAEAAWCMKVASSNFSYNSCEDISQLFHFMFQCPISRDISIGRTKVSYIMSDGLGPYFNESLCKMVRSQGNHFTAQFDETTTLQNKKQLDVLLRFWSEAKGEVVTRFFKALFFGHAKGKDVSKDILSCIEEHGLPKELLLSIGSDGPNVNKTIYNEMNAHLKGLGLPGLVDFLPCNIHVVHNGFKHGIGIYGQQAEQMAIDVFYWFKAHPARKEDFLKEQSELGFSEEMFIRHVQCRWLTLLPALERIIDNWDPLHSYFLKELPRIARLEKTERTLEQNESYKRICKSLQDKSTLIQMHFLIGVKELFDGILCTFQRQEPLIHVLHDECVQLIKKLMLRFLKPAACDVGSRRLKKTDVKEADIQLPDDKLEVGEKALRALSKLSHDQRKLPLKGMRAFLQGTTQYLLTRLPIGDTFLRDLTVLHPEMQQVDGSEDCIRRIAQKLPQIIDESKISSTVDEWKLYKRQSIPDEWHEKEDGSGSARVDHYWCRVFKMKTLSGAQMFPNLMKLVKGVLSMCHGNADVERGLSLNKHVIGTDRTLLTPESVNGLRNVKDAVSANGGIIHNMDFNKNVVQCTRNANAEYKRRLEERRKLEEAQKKKQEAEAESEKAQKLAEQKAFEERKRKLKDTEKQLQTEQGECQAKLRSAEAVFAEANKRLADALKSKHFKEEVAVAQGLLEVAHRQLKAAQQEMEDWQKKRASLDAKRMKMIDSLKHS